MGFRHTSRKYCLAFVSLLPWIVPQTRLAAQTARETRRFSSFRAETLALLATIGVKLPRRLVARDSIVVIQDGRREVVSLGQHWMRNWRAINPDSTFRITSLDVTGGGAILGFDVATQVMWRADPSRTLRPSLAIPSSTSIESLLALGGERFVGVSRDTAAPVVTFDRTGRILSRKPFSEPTVAAMHPLIRQGRQIRGRSNSEWILVFSFLDGFLYVGSDNKMRRFRGLQQYPMPDIEIKKTAAGDFVRLPSPSTTSFSGVVARDEVLLLPGDRKVVATAGYIDRYRIQDGWYVGSYDIREVVRDVAYNGSEVLILTDYALLRLRAIRTRN
jgi:hypothetical protein